MAQELGRISRPASSQFEGRRKLLLVPLVYGPPADEPDGVTVLQKYWDQMQTQVTSLASALGGLHHVYHESLHEGGEQGLEMLQQADQRSHEFVISKCDSGAVLEATEDGSTLLEALDLQRCLMLPLASEQVAHRLQEWLNESNKTRYEHIARQIDSTLGENEVGLLLVSERHQIQFPDDIDVFYVAPPALDEFRRWLQNWALRQQQRQADERESQQQPTTNEPVADETSSDEPRAEK